MRDAFVALRTAVRDAVVVAARDMRDVFVAMRDGIVAVRATVRDWAGVPRDAVDAVRVAAWVDVVRETTFPVGRDAVVWDTAGRAVEPSRGDVAWELVDVPRVVPALVAGARVAVVVLARPDVVVAGAVVDVPDETRRTAARAASTASSACTAPMLSGTRHAAKRSLIPFILYKCDVSKFVKTRASGK